MRLYRAAMEARGVLPASALKRVHRGRTVRVAGCVICRQRPGTAKGFLFLSLEDETGIANAIVEPELFDQHRAVLTGSPYLMIEGLLQNQQGAISVKVRYAECLNFAEIPVKSHDFH
jgi:error-prone DNA polymerase